MADAKTFMIEDARIMFRNFEGNEGPYNRKGDRNFAVVIPDSLVQQLIDDGWNVKFLPAREEGDEDVAYVQVAVSFKNRPPRVVMITSSGRTNLNEETIESLDHVDIKVVDVICRAYEWTVQDKTGIKAYLQTMFVTINEDALELKYGVGGGDSGSDD